MLGYKERFSKETSSLGDRHRDGIHLDQPSRTWWPKAAPAGFVLQKGWEAQVNEYLPVHKLEVDVDKLHVQVFGGQKTNAHSIWEIHLSHAQMVGMLNLTCRSTSLAVVHDQSVTAALVLCFVSLPL
jgi:hypothetical protein